MITVGKLLLSFKNLKQTDFHVLKINNNNLFSYLDSFRCELTKLCSFSGIDLKTLNPQLFPHIWF